VAAAYRFWRFRGLGHRACGTLGRLVFLLAAALVFLSAAAVARIIASDLDLGPTRSTTLRNRNREPTSNTATDGTSKKREHSQHRRHRPRRRHEVTIALATLQQYPLAKRGETLECIATDLFETT
jgi:hypothetical protein